MSNVHVYPTKDIIEHELKGDDCPCGVTSEPVKRDDGSMGWVIIHHSLDGRERYENGGNARTPPREGGEGA